VATGSPVAESSETISMGASAFSVRFVGEAVGVVMDVWLCG
jgi:hypothetical protein